MAVIPGLEKYKTYITEMVKCKNGVTKPITKVKYLKPCPQCGGEMFVLSHKKGGVYKRSITRWWCQDRICGHSEIEETNNEYLVRKSHEQFDTERNLAFGMCPHKQNMTTCLICNEAY